LPPLAGLQKKRFISIPEITTSKEKKRHTKIKNTLFPWDGGGRGGVEGILYVTQSECHTKIKCSSKVQRLLD